MQKKYAFLGVVALVVVVVAASIAVDADRPRLKASKHSPAFRTLVPTDLPPVTRLPQQVSLDKAQSVLQFDDGSCESGLGANTTVTSWVDFDVPAQCVMGGLEVIQATGRFNTAYVPGSAHAALLGQAGGAPPAVGGGQSLGLAGGNFNTAGQCPAQAGFVQQKALNTPGVVAGTSNFFFGIRHGGFWGRDTNGPPAGRIWFGCGACGMTQYSPAFLQGAGFGGNWMLRVTVEDTNCLPPELEGACCLSETDCLVTTAGACSAQGGSFRGGGTDCSDVPATCESLWVSLHSMSAVTMADGSVAVRWTTEQEVDTVGFRVLREDTIRSREKANRTALTVVAAMIPAQGAGLTGATYEVVDASAQARTATTYWLEDIDINGRVTRHGPIVVERVSRRTR
jgi:hypothetical protein